jgi:glyoxylase-like metal-dependent hydrolase (beta-lactamase superfamily II)
MTAPGLGTPLAPPAVGEARDVVPGVRWLRLPVPGPLRHINVWLLDDGPGWTLIDTGMDDPAARAVWEQGPSTFLEGRPIHRIVCTHHHPDHAGLAAWLAEVYSAPVYMSPEEARLLRVAMTPDEAMVAAYERDGLPLGAAVRAVVDGRDYRACMSGLPEAIRDLDEGATVTAGSLDWRIRRVGGHTDGQLVLEAPAAGLFIAGDQVLPRISSNIGVYPEQRDEAPLATYLVALERLAGELDDPQVLPSHGDVFVGLKTRIGQLQSHHAAMLERVRGLLDATPRTAHELAGRLYRPGLDALNTVMALGEALAHLVHLADLGQAQVAEGDDGRRRFWRA